MSRHFYRLFAALFMLACSSTPPPAPLGARVGRYLRAHPTTPAVIATAMQRGHVVIGMTAEQVLVTMGEPRTRHRGRAERWLYPAALFHQDQSSHGASLARIAFVDGRVALVEFF